MNTDRAVHTQLPLLHGVGIFRVTTPRIASWWHVEVEGAFEALIDAHPVLERTSFATSRETTAGTEFRAGCRFGVLGDATDAQQLALIAEAIDHAVAWSQQLPARYLAQR